MKITAITTDKITDGIGFDDVTAFLDKYVELIEENSVLVVASKVIAILENRTTEEVDRLETIIRDEADLIAKTKNKYGRNIVIKHNAFLSQAGIDQSNGNGRFILLPKNPTDKARNIYVHLANKFNLKNFGVIISDSSSSPLRLGATGVSIGFWGFSPLKSYVGNKDLFGRDFEFERSNQVDAIASAANLVMGEGNECAPLAIVSGLDMIEFSPTSPTKEELTNFYVSVEDDYFHPLLDNSFSN